MKNIFLFTLLIFSFILTGCDILKSSEVVTQQTNQDGVVEISNESTDCKLEDLGTSFSRDCNFAYHNDKKIEGSDGPSFEVLHFRSKVVAKDNKHVYELRPIKTDYFVQYDSPADGVTVEIVEYLDAATYEMLDETYAKDKNYGYVGITKIDNSDGSSFEVIKNNTNYTKDKNNVYYKTNILPGLDAQTFVFIGEVKMYDYLGSELPVQYYKDKNGVYLNHELINSTDPSSFIVIQDGFAKDKNNVYYSKKVIPGIDPSTFELLQGVLLVDDKPSRTLSRNTYSKDKDNIYCLYYDNYNKTGEVVKMIDVDYDSFEPIWGVWYTGKDKYNYFNLCKVKAPIDTTSTNSDADFDGLILEKEQELGTNQNDPDTDGDGYLDGDEVKNGYDPLIKPISQLHNSFQEEEFDNTDDRLKFFHVSMMKIPSYELITYSSEWISLYTKNNYISIKKEDSEFASNYRSTVSPLQFFQQLYPELQNLKVQQLVNANGLYFIQLIYDTTSYKTGQPYYLLDQDGNVFSFSFYTDVDNDPNNKEGVNLGYFPEFKDFFNSIFLVRN